MYTTGETEKYYDKRDGSYKVSGYVYVRVCARLRVTRSPESPFDRRSGRGTPTTQTKDGRFGDFEDNRPNTSEDLMIGVRPFLVQKV